MAKYKILGIVVAISALFTLNSCDSDDEANTVSTSLLGTNTLSELIGKNGSLSSLETALGKASGDLPGTLNGSEAFTVFAPNDVAFEGLATRLGFESAKELLEKVSPELLQRILSYHVVPGTNGIADLTDGTSLSAVAGGDLTVTSAVVDDKKVVQILDASKVEQTNPVASIQGTLDYASNGIVHIIDKVLLSQDIIDELMIDTRPSLLDWAKSNEDLTTLVAAIEKAGLVDTVNGLDTATILAPTNQAFVELLNTLGDDYNSLDDFDNEAEIAFLGDVLKYHVLTVGASSSDLSAGDAATASEGNTVAVIAENSTFVFGDATAVNANIEIADLEANNGYVHIIDKVLVSQTALDFLGLLGSDDLATTVSNTPQLSILSQAVVATGLVGMFTDTTNESFVQMEDEKDEDFEKRRTPSNFTYFKPATVFAPSDAAFAELFDALGADFTGIDSFDTEEELALLKEIVLYHTISGRTTSAKLEAGTFTTAAGSDLEIRETFGTNDFVISNANNNVIANLVTPDVLARNGVAHMIDKVLLPENAVIFVKSLK